LDDQVHVADAVDAHANVNVKCARQAWPRRKEK
jgi:hypothetical protein